MSSLASSHTLKVGDRVVYTNSDSVYVAGTIVSFRKSFQTQRTYANIIQENRHQTLPGGGIRIYDEGNYNTLILYVVVKLTSSIYIFLSRSTMSSTHGENYLHS